MSQSEQPSSAERSLAIPNLVGFWEAFHFWLKLGFVSFGGPAGQIAIMHQELVEKRRWISEQRFFTCTELLHVVVRTGSATVGYLHWLADASQLGRYRCWRPICATVASNSDRIELDLHGLRPYHHDSQRAIWYQTGCDRHRDFCSVSNWL